MYDNSVGKYVKGVLNVIIDGSLGWGFDRFFGSGFCGGVCGEVNMSNMESNLWVCF